MPKGGFRSFSHSFCLEPQIILLGLGKNRQTLRLLWLAPPAPPKKLCLVQESSGSSSSQPEAVWKETASGGWCSTLGCHKLRICVKRWQSGVWWLLLFLSHLMSDKYFFSKSILPSSLKLMLFLHLKLCSCLQQNHVFFIVSCCFYKYWTVDFSANDVT